MKVGTIVLVIAASHYRWMVTYEEDDTRQQEVQLLADNYATVSNLDPCTKYIFYVAAVSPKDAMGSAKTARTTMDETGGAADFLSLLVICIDTACVVLRQSHTVTFFQHLLVSS